MLGRIHASICSRKRKIVQYLSHAFLKTIIIFPEPRATLLYSHCVLLLIVREDVDLAILQSLIGTWSFNPILGSFILFTLFACC